MTHLGGICWDCAVIITAVARLVGMAIQEVLACGG